MATPSTLAQVRTAPPGAIGSAEAGTWKWPIGGSSGQAIGTTRSTKTPPFCSDVELVLQPGLVDRGDPGLLAGDGQRRDRQVDRVGVLEQGVLDHADQRGAQPRRRRLGQGDAMPGDVGLVRRRRSPARRVGSSAAAASPWASNSMPSALVT